MRHFLILFEDLPIDKNAVKAGINSQEVVTACRCINVGLFMSRSLRRDVIISIAVGPYDDLKIISFPGETLRRVSPDERSISFFLLKSLMISEKLVISMSETMDNGIIVHRTDFDDFLRFNPSKRIILADPDEQEMNQSDIVSPDSILIYDTRNEGIQRGVFEYRISRPKDPERFILDVNMSVDRSQ